MEVDRDLVAVASHYQPPHQNGLVSQHGVLSVAHVFKDHLVSLRQIHIHHLAEKKGSGMRPLVRHTGRNQPVIS